MLTTTKKKGNTLDPGLFLLFNIVSTSKDNSVLKLALSATTIVRTLGKWHWQRDQNRRLSVSTTNRAIGASHYRLNFYKWYRHICAAYVRSNQYKCLIKPIFVTATYYIKENGKTVAVINGFTFCCADRSKHTNRWICTRNNICRVAFSATKDGRVIRLPNAHHNHPPPKYCIHNGLYMKLWFA